jgi:crotonobetainyl-CoA:carnitine CoA-transferase CaiB-like acyl-CoA transferase
VPDADFGSVRMANVVPRFASAPCQIQHSGGDIGRDNEAFFATDMGLTAEHIAALRAAHII